MDEDTLARIKQIVADYDAVAPQQAAGRCCMLCLRVAPQAIVSRLNVRRATSFAIRIAAGGDTTPVSAFLARHVPPDNPAIIWVLWDAICSVTRKFLPEWYRPAAVLGALGG